MMQISIIFVHPDIFQAVPNNYINIIDIDGCVQSSFCTLYGATSRCKIKVENTHKVYNTYVVYVHCTYTVNARMQVSVKAKRRLLKQKGAC